MPTDTNEGGALPVDDVDADLRTAFESLSKDAAKPPIESAEQDAPAEASKATEGESGDAKETHAKETPAKAGDAKVKDEPIKDRTSEPLEDKDLAPFRERARHAGQTLAQALGAYVGIEDLLRRDAAQGLLHITRNLGLPGSEAAALFQRLAAQLGGTGVAALGSSPSAPAPKDGDPAAFERAIQQALAPLAQRIDSFEREDQARRLRAEARVIEQFRSDPKHRHYKELEAIINTLFASGTVQRSGDFAADLAQAYESACWQHPQVREQLITERSARIEEERKAREKAAVEKARSASRSVTGSPQPGATETVRPDDDDLEAEIRRNLRAAAI